MDLHADLTNYCFIELDKHTISNRKNIILGCIYKSPHVSIANINGKNNDLCFSLSNTTKYIYLLGDSNINLSDTCSNNLHTQKFENRLFSIFAILKYVSRKKNEKNNSQKNFLSKNISKFH